MNSFGRIFRISIFGESHGESVGIVIDGCPAGLPLTVENFLPDLERRKEAHKKEQHQEKKKTSRFLKAASSMIKLPALLSLSYLKIKMFAHQIMKSKEIFHVPAMQIS